MARNLRAAGRGTIRFGRRRAEIRAVELDQEGAVRFINEVIAPLAAESKLGDCFVRNIDRIDLDQPAATAVGKPVFEIFPIESGRLHGDGSSRERVRNTKAGHRMKTLHPAYRVTDLAVSLDF